jgi:predicted nucleic acid-binding Zn ribbon protein
MSAILCEVATRGYDTGTITPDMYARVGAPVQERHCPFCDAVIYSRRHKLCGVCAQELPEQMLFNAAQAENVRSILQDERQRHRAWLQRFNFAN